MGFFVCSKYQGPKLFNKNFLKHLMISLKSKIQEIKNINLESFDIEVLAAMQSEIKYKLKDLENEIDRIKQSIKGANVYKEFYGDTKLLPKKFTTPLRRIVSKQREVREIQKVSKQVRRRITKTRKHNTKKKIDNIQNTKIGFTSFTKSKILLLLF